MDWKYAKHFLKGLSKEHLCEIISKFDLCLKKIFLTISSSPCSARASIHQNHVSWQIEILWTNEKGHPRNISVKLFQKQLAGLTLSQTANFRLFQIERVYRRQYLDLIKMEDSYQNG